LLKNEPKCPFYMPKETSFQLLLKNEPKCPFYMQKKNSFQLFAPYRDRTVFHRIYSLTAPYQTVSVPYWHITDCKIESRHARSWVRITKNLFNFQPYNDQHNNALRLSLSIENMLSTRGQDEVQGSRLLWLVAFIFF